MANKYRVWVAREYMGFAITEVVANSPEKLKERHYQKLRVWSFLIWRALRILLILLLV